MNKKSGDPTPLQSFEVGEQDLDKGRARGRRLVADLHEDSTLRGASAGITTSFDIHASSPLDAPQADGGWPSPGNTAIARREQESQVSRADVASPTSTFSKDCSKDGEARGRASPAADRGRNNHSRNNFYHGGPGVTTSTTQAITTLTEIIRELGAGSSSRLGQ